MTTWEKKGAPKEGRGEWNIKKLVDWKYQSSEMSPEVRKLTAEADLKEAKAKQEKIKLSLTEDRFLDAKVINVHLKRLFTALKQSLVSLGHRVGGELNSIDPVAAIEAKKIIEQEIRTALEDIAKGREIRVRKSKRG